MVILFVQRAMRNYTLQIIRFKGATMTQSIPSEVRATAEKSHYDDMLAFIEKVKSCDLANCVPDIQAEAFELINKVRG